MVERKNKFIKNTEKNVYISVVEFVQRCTYISACVIKYMCIHRKIAPVINQQVSSLCMNQSSGVWQMNLTHRISSDLI